ncbi:MAG: hypothetical protein ABR595_08585 [Psychroflexus sp.]
MRLFVIFCLSIQFIFGQVQNELDNNIAVEITKNQQFLIHGNPVDLENVSQHSEEKDFEPYVTIIANENTSSEIIEKLQNAIKKTSVKVLNLQREVVNRYNDGQDITDEILKQYNTLVKDWVNLPEDARYYRTSDLEFVASVSKNMSFDQRIRNEKLPGFLPIVKEEVIQNDLTQDKLNAWKKNSNYIITVKDDIISQTAVDSLNVEKFKGYRLKKRIIDEERKIIIELVKGKRSSLSISF